MNALTQAAHAFPAAHAHRHRLREGGRESLAHMLMLPDLGIGGFVYPTVLADGSAKGRAALFGPGLDAPIQEQVDQVVPDTLGFEDWRTGPLRMAVVEPHKTVDVTWDGERIQFQGRFEALHPPYAFSLHPEGNPPYYGDDRTEQHGRLTAELTVDGPDEAGRKAEVSCEAFATIQLEFDPKIYLNEAAVTLDIDGSPGTGWCEFCWNRDYFAFAKQHVATYG